MAVIAEIIRVNEDGTLSFGDYTLQEKTKVTDFEVNGRMYKAKTFNEVTKLKKDGALVYESLPGTAVHELRVEDKEISFSVEGMKISQITLELEAETEYKLTVDDVIVDNVKTSIGGKVSFSIDLNETAKSVVLKKIN